MRTETPNSSTPSSQWSPSYKDSILRTKPWKWNQNDAPREFNRVSMHESVSDGQCHTCTKYFSVDRACPFWISCLQCMSHYPGIMFANRWTNLSISALCGSHVIFPSIHWETSGLQVFFLFLASEAPSNRLGLQNSLGSKRTLSCPVHTDGT